MTSRISFSWALTIISIVFVTLNLRAGNNFGSAFGGSLLGSFVGSTFSNAVTQPRQQQPAVVERTIYVQQQPQQPHYYDGPNNLNKQMPGTYYNQPPKQPSTIPAKTKRELIEENRRLRLELEKVRY